MVKLLEPGLNQLDLQLMTAIERIVTHRFLWHVQVAKRTFMRELPEAVWQGDSSSGSFDFALIPALRDSRGAQEGRAGNFRRTEIPRKQKFLFSLLHRPEECAILDQPSVG